jgi:hypothetical protein
MRDLLNIINNIVTESTGLANRKPGTLFTNPEGDQLIFQGLNFYPNSGAFGSSEELAAAVDRLSTQLSRPIEWTNALGKNLGFGIATFTDPQGNTYYLGRYFQKINPNRLQNNFPNTLPAGFKLQNKAAKKEASGYKPTEVLTQLENLTPDDIFQQVVSKFGPGSDEVVAMQAFMDSPGRTEFPIGKMNFTAFTNYFCEILQPMSLVLGKKIKGNAQDAERKFLGGSSYGECTISFNSGKNDGLFDSSVVSPSGQSIGISTKAKNGAKASAKNLDDKIQEMIGDPDGEKILNKFKKEVDILEMIVDGGYINGPLNLAVMYKIISAEEAQQVRDLRGLSPREIEGRLSAKLKKMYSSRNTTDASKMIPFFHMLAAVAFEVADYINENTNFGPAAAAILNYGAFMQCYTNANQRGSNIVLDEFQFQYPSEAVTDVLLSADKTYYSTGNKGNFTFKILKNGASEEDVTMPDDTVNPTAEPELDVEKLDAVAQSPRLKGPGAKIANTVAAPKTDVATLGREKRQR